MTLTSDGNILANPWVIPSNRLIFLISWRIYCMKILFLDQSGQSGGAELCLMDIARMFRERSLIGLFADGPFKTLLEQQHIPVQVLTHQPLTFRKESSFLSGLRLSHQVLPLIQKVVRLSRDYDLIYANTQKALLVAALASLFGDRPLVYHLHDILSPEHFNRTNQRLIVGLANRFATRVIANSGASAAAFVQAGGRADLVTVIYNGFDPALYQFPAAEASALKQQLGFKDCFLVGHFSRFSPWKGQHILLEALAGLPPQVTAIFVGEALFGEQDYSQTLKAQVNRLELQNRVRFLGFQNEIIPLMHACDLVTHTSIAPEPFGRVVVEAMLCGKPVIASGMGGVKELIESGTNGWLVPPGDPQQLAATIAHCRNHPEQTEAIAQMGHQQANQRFQVHHTNQQILELLQSINLGPTDTSVKTRLEMEL
jgi:glycosyltransferase involved in cell wall biosynthesis